MREIILWHRSGSKDMEKLGNTPFVWGDLKIQMEDSIFVPMSALNQIRRDALTKLQEELLKPYRRSLTGKASLCFDRQSEEHTSLSGDQCIL